MGKFFNGRVKKDRTTLIRYVIIGCGIFFIILLFILIAAKSNKKSNVVLVPKESITVEVNSDWPENTDFFESIENYDKNLITVDYQDLDVTTVGEYEVQLNAEGYNSVKVMVKVVDTTAPELTLKELTIDYGDAYDIEDFVELCEDNSGDECIIEYYGNSQDQTGKTIDYSAFTEENTYLIKIVAKDNSGNETEVKETKLIIGSGEGENTNQGGENCTYGNLDVSQTRVSYPIAVIVGDQNANCALNRDLWDDSEIQIPVNKFYSDDYEALKKDIDSMLKTQFPNGAKIVAYPNFVAILNDEIKGLVGYAIYVKVYIVANDYTGTVDSDDNLVLAYYIRRDHTRQYVVNKYNVK